MRKATLWLMAILVAALLQAAAAQAPQKTVLIFKLPVPASETEKNLARSVTVAFKEAMVQAGASDALIFDPESPTAKRALFERSLPASVTEDKLPINDALKAGRVLGARFVVAGDMEDDKSLHVLLADTENDEVTSIGTIDLSDRSPAKLRETAQALGKQGWARLSTLVDQSGQDEEQADKKAEKAIAAAQKYVDSGEMELASDELNRAIRLAPKDPEVRLAVGRFYLSQGKLANAIVELRTAVNLDATQVVYRLWLSEAYLQKQMYNEAESEIRRGITLAPSEPRLYSELGKVYFMKGALDDAVTQLNRSLEISRKDPDVLVLLGDILVKKGRMTQGIAAYEEAAKLRPNDAQLYQRLAAVYGSQGMLAESLTASGLALKSAPYTDDQRYNEAIRIVDEHTRGLLAKFEVDSRVFQNGAMGKGDYSQACQALSSRAGALSKFLAGFTPPESAKQSYRQRMLGLGLLSQAADKQASAVEPGNEEDAEEARLLMLQARRELTQARTGSSEATTTPAPAEEPGS